MRSLRATLGLGLAISLTAIVLLQWWLVSHAFREITENYVVSRLQKDIDMLLGAITFDNNGAAYLQLNQQTYFDDRPFSGHYYHIRIDNRVLRSATLWDQDLDVAVIKVGQKHQAYLTGPLDQQLLALSGGFRKQGRQISISVAEDISALRARMDAFQTRYLLLSGFLLLLLLILQHFLMRRTLMPLKDVQADLKNLARGDIQTVRENVPPEIQPLVREVNRLLILLGQRVERSRRMVGNLAHGLKTPLSVLRQVGQSTALDQQPVARQQILAQTNMIHQRLERELNRARLAGSSSTGARFNPGEDLPALIAILELAYDSRGIRIESQQHYHGNWPAEREDMLELIGNLLDNACKWARSQVRITIASEPEVALLVEDDGESCPPELHTTLGQRGKRFDEQTDGHGLGLAIVRDIVDHYQGEIDFDTSALGGLRIEVKLMSQNSR